jgi:hypothetical protein
MTSMTKMTKKAVTLGTALVLSAAPLMAQVTDPVDALVEEAETKLTPLVGQLMPVFVIFIGIALAFAAFRIVRRMIGSAR